MSKLLQLISAVAGIIGVAPSDHDTLMQQPRSRAYRRWLQGRLYHFKGLGRKEAARALRRRWQNANAAACNPAWRGAAWAQERFSGGAFGGGGAS